MIGIEPTTFCLTGSCSTAELHGHRISKYLLLIYKTIRVKILLYTSSTEKFKYLFYSINRVIEMEKKSVNNSLNLFFNPLEKCNKMLCGSCDYNCLSPEIREGYTQAGLFFSTYQNGKYKQV